MKFYYAIELLEKGIKYHTYIIQGLRLDMYEKQLGEHNNHIKELKQAIKILKKEINNEQ